MSVATVAEVQDIQERLAERAAAEAQAAADYTETMCPAVRPLLKVADSYIDFIKNPHGRIMTGVHEIDLMMRGIGRGELCFVFGQLHQGKTQLVLNIVANNSDKRILFYTPDEMAEEVLVKLIAIKHRVEVESLETRIREGDPLAITMLREAATKDFPNLMIVDEGYPLKKLKAIRQQLEQEVWRGDCDLMVIDYLGSVPGYADEAMAAKAVKALAKNERQRVLCIQQSRKDEDRRGSFRGVQGMLYGGQNEANQMIEVCRPADSPFISDAERSYLGDVLAWNLCKNKRPPFKQGRGKLYIHPKYGSLSSWSTEHNVANGAPTGDAMTAMKANNVHQLRRS